MFSRDERLQSGADVADNAAGAHNDPTNQTQMLCNVVTVKSESSRA
jgi:hypothetical protein